MGLPIPFAGISNVPLEIGFTITSDVATVAVAGISTGSNPVPIPTPSIGVLGIGSAMPAPSATVPPQSIGVKGQSASGIGVQGQSSTGEGVLGVGRNGVHGQSSSPSDSGVWGENTGGG